MSGKEKVPAPPPKAPAPPVKQASPPAAPQPAADEKKDAEAPAAAAAAADLSQTPVGGSATGPAPGTLAPRLKLSGLSPPMPGLQPSYVLPSVPPIDWLAIRATFTERNAPFSPRVGDAVEKQWLYTYRTAVSLGFDPALAVKISNGITPVAVGNALKNDFPTVIEQSDREIGKMTGKDPGTIILPITGGIEALSGGRLKFSF